MRFSPRFTIRKKSFFIELFFLYLFFLLVVGTVRDTGGAPWPFVILVHNFSTGFFSVLDLLYLEEISFINLSPTFFDDDP